MVEFDDYNGPTLPGTNYVPIVPISQDSNGDHSIHFMKNIPLVLAWARTTHKSEGHTLGKCVCDLGKSEASLGLTYVGLSRTRCLADLRIMNVSFERLTSYGTSFDMLARNAEAATFTSNNIIS
jgi:ATP-dependent DNA helicase PIF1